MRVSLCLNLKLGTKVYARVVEISGGATALVGITEEVITKEDIMPSYLMVFRPDFKTLF